MYVKHEKDRFYLVSTKMH